MQYEWLKECERDPSPQEIAEAAFNSIRKYFPDGIEKVEHGHYQSRVEYNGGWIDIVFLSEGDIIRTNILIVNSQKNVFYAGRFEFPIQFCEETDRKFRACINF